MFESKYSKVLTVILVIVIIAILGLLGFLAYDYYQKYNISQDASEFVDNFNGEISEEEKKDEGNATSDVLNGISSTPTGESSSTVAAQKGDYKGFATVGTMEIPAINFSYPIIDSVSRSSIEASVAVLYPPGGESINQPGNTVIIGHNYRNGVFFSNNKRLNNGDKIYVTDYRGKKLSYTIETDDNDTSFYQRETDGKAELTLSTCTDASNNRRLIILARED